MRRNSDNTNAKGRANNSMAFQVTNPNFLSQLEESSDDKKVLLIIVMEAKNLPYTDPVSCTTDPFCRVNVIPQVQDFDQLQRTSRICYTTDPVWWEGERFLFIVEDESKIMFNMQRNLGLNPTVAKLIGRTRKYLGDALIEVSNFTTQMKEFTVPLIDPETGSAESSLTFRGKFISRDEASGTRADTAFQYQRYCVKWHDDNLLPSDPGRFSNWNNTRFGDGFDDIIEPIPEGWKIVSEWTTVASEHGSGWMYATDFLTANWFSDKSPTAFVRRKTWTRLIARNDLAADIILDDQLINGESKELENINDTYDPDGKLHLEEGSAESSSSIATQKIDESMIASTTTP